MRWTPSSVLAVLLVANLAVAGAKLAYGHVVGSIAIGADGLHSLTDGLNNVVGLWVLHWAMRPADRGHPYGHRRFELVGSAAVGLMLLAMALSVLRDVFAGSQGTLPSVGAGGWALLFGTLVVNLGVARWEAKQGRLLKSSLLEADSQHTQSDILVTLGVMASAALSNAGLRGADTLAGGAVALIIGFAGAKILYRSLHVLSDRAPLDVEQIHNLVLSVPGVRNAHAIRSRGAPGAVHVDLSVHVAPDLSIQQAHLIADRVEAALRRDLPDVVDVVVHAEPDGHAPDETSSSTNPSPSPES